MRNEVNLDFIKDMQSSFAIRCTTILVLETIGGFFWFPLWWYSFGLQRCLRHAGASLARREETLGIRLWMSTLFQPMYGQTDIQSRVISIVFRIGILFIRMMMLAVWMILLFISLLAYVAVPIGIVYGLFLTL